MDSIIYIMGNAVVYFLVSLIGLYCLSLAMFGVASIVYGGYALCQMVARKLRRQMAVRKTYP